MIEAIRAKLFSGHYHLCADGKEAAVLKISWRKARLEYEGRKYALWMQGWLSPDHLLACDGAIIAKVKTSGVLKTVRQLAYADKHYQIKVASGDKLYHRIKINDNAETVGRIDARDWKQKRIEIDLPGDWPIPVQAFILWVGMPLMAPG